MIFLQISALNLEGSSSSYAQFARWHIAANSSLELQFRTRYQKNTKLNQKIQKKIPNNPNTTKITRQGDGLILYMDDGGYFDFIEIKLVSGALRWEDQIRLCQSLINALLRCRFNLGEGAETLSLGRELHDGAWHRSVNFNIGSFLRASLEHFWPFWSFLSIRSYSILSVCTL